MKAFIIKKVLALVILASSLIMLMVCQTFAQSGSQDILSDVDEFVNSKMEELRIKGAAIGIVQNNKIYTKGYGVSNTEESPVTPQTPFILGSTTKSITALAVMQLVEAGKVNLDDSVQKYIPWFHVADEASANIKVCHLLNQTSGIPDTAGNYNYLDNKSTQEDFVKKLSEQKLVSAPGGEYHYAEANYVILGVLISNVSGQSYEDYIEKHVFTPLEMNNSFTAKDKAVKNGLSKGYRTCFGFPFEADIPYPKQYVAASYLISSAEDMAHYLHMYMNGGRYNETSLLSSEGVGELFEPGPKLQHPEGYSYSMGWFVSEENKIHDGRPTNYYSCILLDSKNKVGIVLLTNTNNRLVTAEYSMPVAFGISDIVSGKRVQNSSFGFRQLYLLFNIIILVFIALLLLRLVLSLTIFRKKLQIQKGLRKAILSILPDVLVFLSALCILIYLLVSMQIAFSIAMLGQPDIVISFILIMAVSLINLFVRLILILVSRNQRLYIKV